MSIAQRSIALRPFIGWMPLTDKQRNKQKTYVSLCLLACLFMSLM